MMMKIFYKIAKRLMPQSVRPDAAGCGDALSHPAIRAMSPDELADLPFASARKRP